MTKVKINPGVCGFITSVTAESEDGMEVTVQVKSGCKAVMQMMSELGDTFDSFDVCLKKPGENEFYQYASKNFPGHAACPIVAGITKAIEAECKLALPRESSITFEE